MKILLVEDSDETFFHFNEMLWVLNQQQQGETYRLINVITYGEQVVEAVEKELPDLALIDLHLPGEWDGNRVALFLQKHYPEITIVIWTVFPEQITTSVEAHIDGILSKTCTLQELRTALDTAVWIHRKKMNLQRIIEAQVAKHRTLWQQHEQLLDRMTDLIFGKVDMPLEMALARHEEFFITKALIQYDFDIEKTAALLEISQSTLYRKIKKHGIDKKGHLSQK